MRECLGSPSRSMANLGIESKHCRFCPLAVRQHHLCQSHILIFHLLPFCFLLAFPLIKLMPLFKYKFIENPYTRKLFSQASVALFSSIIQVVLLLMC